jgi:serine/threonine protein phosphatase PrpC
VAFHLDCYGITDVGRVRSSNQDQFVIADLKPALAVVQASIGGTGAETLFGEDCVKLLVIADGIGGQPGGRRASELVVQSILEHMLKNLPTTCGGEAQDMPRIRDLLLQAVAFCESNLAREARQCPAHQDDAHGCLYHRSGPISRTCRRLAVLCMSRRSIETDHPRSYDGSETCGRWPADPRASR